MDGIGIPKSKIYEPYSVKKKINLKPKSGLEQAYFKVFFLNFGVSKALY